MKLPDALQANIEKRFNAIEQPKYDLSNASKEFQEAAAKRPTNFREILKAGADAFEAWRYLYEFEKDTDLNAYGLFPLPHILREIIVEREPQWARWGIRLTKAGVRIPPTPRAPSKPEPTAESQTDPSTENL